MMHRGGTFNLRLGQAIPEVPALLDDHDLDWLCAQEVGGRKRLRSLRRQVRRMGYRVRATRNADTAIVVRRGVRIARVRRHHLGRQGWERKPGRPGLHPARQAVSLRIGGRRGYRVISVHIPPRGGSSQPLRGVARVKAVRRLAAITSRWTRRRRGWVAAGDWNASPADPLLDPLRGRNQVVGVGVDYAVARGVVIDQMRATPSRLSDHRPRTFIVTA
jgi:exonuclease III